MTSRLSPAGEVEGALAELGLDRSHRPVVTRLAEVGPPAEPVRLPPPGAAAGLLERLGLEPSEVDEVLAARPGAAEHPALWWLLERCHHQLVQQMGRPGALGPWPTLPAADGTPGAVERYLYVWVFVATLPFVRRYHDERQVPEEASWEILAAIGTQMADHRAVSGVGGTHTQDWLTVHFRGLIYAVGRLYYERLPVWFDTEQPGGPRRGGWSLGLHIPSGRLSPAACDESLARAARFFPRHFAEEDYRYAVCTSWVLDPQLAEYLSPTSNIIRYQQRFTLLPDEADDDGNATVVRFVFRRPLADLANLPQETALQRAVVTHIRAGRTWRVRTGWFEL